VLKAIGMSDQQVRMIFIMESVIFGVIGAILGALAFLAVNYWMALNPIMLPVGPLKPVLAADTVISTMLLIIAASLVAGYVPARMASKQKILETIKTVE